MVGQMPTHIVEHDQQAIDALVKRLLMLYADDFLSIVLFGSKARGDDTLQSDIDVLVIVKDEAWAVKHAIRTLGARISLDHNVLFNLYVIAQARWTWMQEIGHPLYRHIVDDGIDLTPVTA